MNIIERLNTEDRIIIASMIITIAGIVVGALMAEPRIFGLNTLFIIAMLIVGWRLTDSPRLGWLLLFGLIVGVLELWVDWVHVTHLDSLVYTDYFGFRLLASPSYMPIGWWLTSVQFGYLALRLNEIWPRWQAVALVSALGMSIPPWYEELAAPAQAWYYNSSGPMLSNTPVWVIVTYAGCMFAMATMALTFYQQKRWKRAMLAGFFTAAGILFSGIFCFSLLG